MGEKPLGSQELIVSHLRTTKHFTLLRKAAGSPFLEQLKKKNQEALESRDLQKIFMRSCENLSNKIVQTQSPRNSKKLKKDQVENLVKKVKEMESTIRSMRKQDFGDVEFIKDLGKGTTGQVKSCYVNGIIMSLLSFWSFEFY